MLLEVINVAYLLLYSEYGLNESTDDEEKRTLWVMKAAVILNIFYWSLGRSSTLELTLFVKFQNKRLYRNKNVLLVKLVYFSVFCEWSETCGSVYVHFIMDKFRGAAGIQCTSTTIIISLLQPGSNLDRPNYASPTHSVRCLRFPFVILVFSMVWIK